MSAAGTDSERAVKARRVRELLDSLELDAVLLRSPAGAAWWSGGGATHLLPTPALGVAALVLEPDGEGIATTVVTAVNEAPRLQSEELAGLDATWRVLPWSTPLETALPTGPRVGTDVALPGCPDVSAALARLRASLVPAEVARLDALGADTARALTRACASLRPADTERHAAALTAAALLEDGIDPVVLLVAGGERLPVHRHPLPTGGPLGELAMVVACGRRSGLVVSLTRYVGTPSPAVADAFDRLLAVDSAVNRATRPGRTLGAVFADLQTAYVEHGFAADEWTRHHQGGPAGYATRDVLAEPGSAEVVVTDQLFAWNPSAPSVKSEDSVLTGADGPRVVTVDAAWPSREVDGLRRPLPRPYD